MKSVFADKELVPAARDLKKALGDTFNLWQELTDFTCKLEGNASAEWYFSGPKFGWSFRISDPKRVVIYLLPRDKYFKAAFVFGKKATDEILSGNLSEIIKSELKAAKVYAEGRGIRIEVKDKTLLKDIKKLISIKMAN